MIKRSTSILLLLTIINLCGAATAQEFIKISTVDTSSGNPVFGKLKVKKLFVPEPGISELPRSGWLQINREICNETPTFEFAPYSKTMYQSHDPLNCSDEVEIVFRFVRHGQARSKVTFHELEFEKYQDSNPDIWIMASEIEKLEPYEYAKIAALSNDLGKRLKDNGFRTDASVVYDYSLENTGLVFSSGSDTEEGVTYNSNGVLRLTDNTVTAIKAFQAEKGITVTGKADWSTLNKISAGYVSKMVAIVDTAGAL